MADAIVSFGVQKLWEFVSQEYNRLDGVREQITELKSDMKMLMSFLIDASVKNQTSALLRNCVEDIKEITDDAEDIIETFVAKEKQRNGMKNHMRSLACIQGGHRKTALEITSIRKRISKVLNVMQTFRIKADIMNGGYSQALLDTRRETRHTFSNEPESILVGVEKNAETLVDTLVGNHCSLGVSITGLGGLGKTTLARQVFNHDKVKRHFDGGLAWVRVSQDIRTKDVWQTILQNLSHGDYVAGVNRSPEDTQKKISDMNEAELQKELFQLLQTKKALIVLDDVWTTKDWDRIKPMFPERQDAGWKLLLISRNDAIHPQFRTFKFPELSNQECWTLLHMIAFPMNVTTGYKIDKEMVKMAKEMVKHCRALPLAVKVLGGLLAAQHTWHQWKMISAKIKSHIESFSDHDRMSFNRFLSLMSFEKLPGYLKHCLLHLASYPEDHSISLEDVSYIWAAEGITKPRYYERARDVSDSYIGELVKRNLVISERDMVSSRFEFCRLHDVMREICLLKADEENFYKIVTNPTYISIVHSQASNQSRRLVVYTNDEDDMDTLYREREIKISKLRSLLFIPVHEDSSFFMGSSFMELQLLSVLDLRRAKFKGRKLPSNIGKLINLKYLSLQHAEADNLPSSIGNLKSLLYLNLDILVDLHVPNVFKEMQELRYLYLPRYQHKKTKLELGGLVKLETLINFSTKHSSVKDLYRMTRLRSLSINIEGFNVDMLASSLRNLRELETLTMKAPRNYEKRSVLGCVHLKKPKLRMNMTRLPDVQHFHSHRTTIELRLIYLKEDPMPILEELPQLKEVILLDNLFGPKKMVCSCRGFPKLKKLELYSQREWEEWIVEEGSMPLLHTLTINRCPKFKELPDGLRYLFSLKNLTMDYEWKERLSVGGADYDKVKHIPSVNYQ